jgi:hypothetical protein
LTLHVTPRFCESFCTVAVNCCVVEIFSEAEAGETDTLTGAVTVIVAEAVFEVSATDVAFSVTVAGLGAFAGALYVTEVVVAPLRVPQLLPLQPEPAKDHVTPLFCESSVTDAVNAVVPMPACTLELPGEIETETTGLAVRVIVATALFVVSVTEVAVSVTVAGFGTVPGAL